MFTSPDLTISEVDQPASMWCDSGHIAPNTFKRHGSDSVNESTRFFIVHSDKSGIHGMYCEPCLIIANYLNKIRKSVL